MNKNKLGILGFILIIFGFYFSFTFGNEFTLGDTILNNIGLKSWSNGNSGFHITFIYSVVIIAIGWILACRYLGEKYPRLVKNIPIYLFTLSIGTVIASNLLFSEKVITNSHSSYDTEKYKISFDGDITVKNINISKSNKQLTIPIGFEIKENLDFKNGDILRIQLIDNKGSVYEELSKNKYYDIGYYGFYSKFNIKNINSKDYYRMVFSIKENDIYKNVFETRIYGHEL